MAQLNERPDFLRSTVEIITAYVGNNRVQPADMATLIRSVRATLDGQASLPEQEAPPGPEKATRVQAKRSITPEALISFVNGKPYKTLKRHLSKHGMTMSQYRERFGLPGNYPSVAPAYSTVRSELAKAIGLGARRRVAPPPTAPLRR